MTPNVSVAGSAEWKRHEQELSLARAYCWLIAVLHPGWAVLLGIFLKDEYNDLVGRTVIGIAFLALGLLSFVSPWLRRLLPTINQFGYCLFAIHWFWIVHLSGMAPIYVIGSMVVSFAFNLAYLHLRQLAIYSVVLLLSALVAVLATDAPVANKFMLIMGLATSQVVGMSFIYMRSRIAKSLEVAETKALKLQQELVERELEAASIVQKNLLAPAPSIPGVSLASFYQSAGKTGGDWYGHYFNAEQNALYVWIGDVTGHGLPAALVTGVVCGAMYAGESRVDFHKQVVSPDERIKGAAATVNRIVHEKGGKLLMTMVFCCLDLDTGELTIVNAGHRFPMIFDGKGSATPVQVRGDILGLSVDGHFPTKKVSLKSGETLFLYTDGLVENAGPDKAILSGADLRRLVAQAKDSTGVIDQVSAEARRLWGAVSIEDDVSMVALTWTRQESRSSRVPS